MLQFRQISRTGYSSRDRITFRAENPTPITEKQIEAWVEAHYPPCAYGSYGVSQWVTDSGMHYAEVSVWASTGD